MHETLIEFFRKTIGDVSIHSSVPLSGGDINLVYKVTTSSGTFCVKKNSKQAFPMMFDAEAHGLRLLAEQSMFRIPEVYGVCSDKVHQYLILDYIDEGSKSHDFPVIFGEQLAAMHKQSAAYFGLEIDNYIGSLPQENTQESTWETFYADQRILPQVKKAVDTGALDSSTAHACETLCQKLNQLFPTEVPALLHGDLWAGNHMIDASGQPCLIDPAVYYGHREMDLGMMHLFGGFSPEIFMSYHRAFPLESGWKKRIPLTQLYPLLVHVNLFGGGYAQQVKSVVRQFV